MNNEIRIRWSVDDGYISGDRPQSFRVRDDVVEEDMSENDLRKLFGELLQEEFEQTASPTSDMEDEFVQWAQQIIAERTKESQ